MAEAPRGYEVPSETRSPARRRNVRAVPTGTANPDAGAPTRAGSRRGLGDLVGMIPVSKATAFVLKFTVGTVLGATVAFLERKVHRGLIQVDSSNPAEWSPVDGSTLKMPTNRAPRI